MSPWVYALQPTTWTTLGLSMKLSNADLTKATEAEKQAAQDKLDHDPYEWFVPLRP